MITTNRVRESDSNSVVEAQAAALFELPQPNASVLWDFASFAPDITTHKYDVGYRNRTGYTVTVNGAVATNGTSIVFDDATSLAQSQMLYDPATKQTVTLGSKTNATTFAILSVNTQDGASRAIIADNAVLVNLSIAEDYHEINAEQTFESTSKDTNYVQDLTIQLPFFRADLEEIRKWGVDKQTLIEETMRRHLRQLNANMYYGIPQENSASVNGQTAGLDYLVRKAGGDYSKAGTNDELSDLKAGFVELRKEGMDASDRPAMIGSVDAYEYFAAKGLATVTVNEQNGATTPYGNIMSGLYIAGFEFVPFIVDPTLTDNHVRITAQTSVQKAYYNGQGIAGEQAVMRLIDEPGLSTSKKPVSTLQMKWGTVIDPNRCKLLETAI